MFCISILPAFTDAAERATGSQAGLDTLQGMGFALRLETPFACIKYTRSPQSSQATGQHW